MSWRKLLRSTPASWSMIGVSWLRTSTTSWVSLAAPVPLVPSPPWLMMVVVPARDSVVELECLGQQTPGFGFGFALGLDGLGLGQTDLPALHRLGLGLGLPLGLERQRRLLAPLALGSRFALDPVL